MIDEAIGKILGMAMAYGVSTLGLFLAYANYRKRILKADKIMTGTAWAVVAVTLLCIGAGVFVVAQLAEPPSATVETAETAPAPVETVETGQKVVDSVPPVGSEGGGQPTEERDRWPLLGIILPASIFFIATWITAGLHRHFSAAGGD